MNDTARILDVGIDVGSTTVKAVVIDESGTILWKEYRRHNTHQPELVQEFLGAITAAFPDAQLRLYITGSGGRSIAPHINASYVQEVNAVTCAVETLHPDTGSVIELGGQDAKVIFWKHAEGSDEKTTLSFMNDKCAGGTGATIDKILGKLGLTAQEACAINPEGMTLHHIAAKCGVFAETDVVGLLKAGIDKGEIFVSLCVAVVKQNLEVLVRGNVLPARVLLLGGPHTYIKAFPELWRKELPGTWALHGYTAPDLPLEQLIYVPDDAQYFAALGAVFFGRRSAEMTAILRGEATRPQAFYTDATDLEHYIGAGRLEKLESYGAICDGLVSSDAELDAFAKEYTIPPFIEPILEKGSTQKLYIGIDGGSTSSKLVLVNDKKELVYKDYVLSKGNPIVDVREIFTRIKTWAQSRDITLDIQGTAVTGYASGILSTAFGLDLSVVETVAHMRSAVNLYGEVDVICDVGGQDIKVLFLRHGRVTDFRLNTQCSAGNGYFLQGMAEQFGIPVERYAEMAFSARKAPAFNYGCAVFMEQDKVNFQQLGWTKEEIMAGLALVLPLNIWNYVVQEPNLAKFGKRFVLQGGTQKNLAAVKAQVDYIREKAPGADVIVHRHADIGGALGAAFEVIAHRPPVSSFVGIDAAAGIDFTAKNDETTRCRFCANRCPRTFIDISSGGNRTIRYITGYGCEKGMNETLDSMREHTAADAKKTAGVPDLVDEAGRIVWDDYDFAPLPAAGTKMPRADYYPTDEFSIKAMRRPTPFERSSTEAAKKRSAMVVGIPRLLNMYYYTPFFNAYFRSLGVKKIVCSDFTTARLWSEGNKWGAIDPCFPAKVAPAHAWNLINKDEVTHFCFPIITHLQSLVRNTLGNNACVIQMGTPEVIEAIFTKEKDVFAEHGQTYWKPLVAMDKPREVVGLLKEYFGLRLEITDDENAWAVAQGFAAQERYLDILRDHGAAAINNLIETDRIGVVVIGHPYHHDPGLNHGIPAEFRKRGFPVFCIESLPTSDAFLKNLFGDSADADIPPEYDIKDVWIRNFNRNTNLKLWAAKVAARHPNLAVIDLSSFKCGHDAPTYSYVANILDASETPHFLFHDIDQNKPGATIGIRIQTIEYFLREEEERLKTAVSHLAK